MLYYALPGKCQWKVLLTASIVFYLCAGPAFFIYLAVLSAVTWYGARKLEQYRETGEKKRKKRLGICVLLVLLSGGTLFVLKWGGMGLALVNRILHTQWSCRFLLPLGVSFFTFQNISYVIDVYKGKTAAEDSFGHYLLYSCYFPYIVSGPINRYEKMKSELFSVHSFCGNRFYEGILRIVWGYLKKMVIADRAAIFVDQVFDNYYMYRGLFIVIAVMLFTLQLYMDFSGCMDIVMGVSRLFGIEMQENFDAPFAAVSTADFWRSWHISLTSWFREYLYIPLGGNRRGKVRKYCNVMIVFLVCGMWHGAGITFLVWGFLNGCYQIVGDMTRTLREKLCSAIGLDQESRGAVLRKRIITFVLAEVAWLFFRADGISEAVTMLKRTVTGWNPWILSDGSLYQLGLDVWDFLILLLGAACVGFVSAAGKKRNLHQEFLAQSWLFQGCVILFALIIWYLFGIYGPGFQPDNFIYYNF